MHIIHMHLMCMRHEVFPANPLISLSLRYRSAPLGSNGDYSSSAIAASNSLALNSIPRLPIAADLSSAKYSRRVRPADAFDAADASADLSTFKSASLTSSRRLSLDRSSIGFALCAVCSVFLARMLCPLEIPLLQSAGMPLALRHAAQCKLSTRLATMPRDCVTDPPIDGAAFDLRFRHCRAPGRITRSACFHFI